VHCCFSDTGPVHEESVSLAGVRETFTKADLLPSAIGDDPCVPITSAEWKILLQKSPV
jgi:hypothetical protein